jgi:hypothetical protein
MPEVLWMNNPENETGVIMLKMKFKCKSRNIDNKKKMEQF